jgi:hypothetical protein
LRIALLLALLADPALAAVAPSEGLRMEPADRALMARVLAESGVEREPEPPDSSYLAELVQALQRALVRALLRGRMLGLPGPLIWTLVALLAVLAAVLFVRLLVSGRRRRLQAGETGTLSAYGPAPVAWDAVAWRGELERRLLAGHIAGSLEALWWWLARSVAGSEAEVDWTSRDLVARSRRQDLRDPLRRLDAFRYGPRQPTLDELRGLASKLEEALP